MGVVDVALLALRVPAGKLLAQAGAAEHGLAIGAKLGKLLFGETKHLAAVLARCLRILPAAAMVVRSGLFKLLTQAGWAEG